MGLTEQELRAAADAADQWPVGMDGDLWAFNPADPAATAAKYLRQAPMWYVKKRGWQP